MKIINFVVYEWTNINHTSLIIFSNFFDHAGIHQSIFGICSRHQKFTWYLLRKERRNAIVSNSKLEIETHIDSLDANFWNCKFVVMCSHYVFNIHRQSSYSGVDFWRGIITIDYITVLSDLGDTNFIGSIETSYCGYRRTSQKKVRAVSCETNSYQVN